MCCLNFTGILSVQLLLLTRYPIQFLPITLQEEGAQWNIIIMGAANRQLGDQGDEIQLWDQENGNGGQVIATTTYSLGEQTTQIVQHHEVQCLAWIFRQKHIKSPKALFIQRRKSNQPLHYYHHTSSHIPPAFLYYHTPTSSPPIHPPYATKLSPISLLPTPPHSPPSLLPTPPPSSSPHPHLLQHPNPGAQLFS